MSQSGGADDVLSTWRRAYHETPERVRRLVGVALFVAQAFVSFVITQSRSFFLNRPTLTVGLISGMVISCLLVVVYSLAEKIEASERDHRTRTTVSPEETPFTSRQLRVIRQMISEQVRREEPGGRPSNAGELPDFESVLDDLRAGGDPPERTAVASPEFSSVESAIAENRELIREVYRVTRLDTDGSDPTRNGDDSEKNQDSSAVSTSGEATRPETELE